MTKNTGKRIKHKPQRTCVGCQKVDNKQNLVRIVRTPNGVILDPTGKVSGRGVYLHNDKECWEKGIKDRIRHALKVDLTEEDKEYLHNQLEKISVKNSINRDQEKDLQVL